jgi:hypothetical protein
MTPEFLSSLAGILISLAASYVPGFVPWFEAQTPNHKRLIMLGLLAASSAAIFGLACQSWLNLVQPGLATCTQEGAVTILRSFGLAAIANQAAYALSPETKAQAQRRAARQLATLRAANARNKR